MRSPTLVARETSCRFGRKIDQLVEAETELILRTRRGHRESFRPLVDRYWARVRSVLRRLVADAETVEDLCQETFLRAFSHLDQFDESRSFQPWLLKIAFHLGSEHCRKRGRSATLVPIDGLQIHTNRPSPGEEAVDRVVVEECLAALPEGYRVLMVLRHGLGLTYEELALVLGEPLGTIKVSLFRARNILRQHLILQEAPVSLIVEGGGERT